MVNIFCLGELINGLSGAGERGETKVTRESCLMLDDARGFTDNKRHSFGNKSEPGGEFLP